MKRNSFRCNLDIAYCFSDSVTSTTWPRRGLWVATTTAATIVPSRGSAALGRCGRAMQQVKRHPVAPDGSTALDDHKRAAGDDGQRWQRLGGGDGRGDGDGVDDESSYHISKIRFKLPLTSSLKSPWISPSSPSARSLRMVEILVSFRTDVVFKPVL